jgi:hypothetical protein
MAADDHIYALARRAIIYSLSGWHLSLEQAAELHRIIDSCTETRDELLDQNDKRSR